jgi:ADP-heptose:LPS heptosyltransferase
MFNVTGSDDARRYGSERWIRVISVFRQRNPDWRAIVAGAPHDAATLQRIAGATGADILPTTVSFHAFAATVMQATLLVTADTSIVHVAAAASVPQVVLYVFNNPALMPWYPYRSPHVALTGYNNVREIEPAHVNDAIEALFSCIATT